MKEYERLPFSWKGTKVNMRGVLLPIIAQIPRTLYVEPYCGARRQEHAKKVTFPSKCNAMIERVETVYIKANHERRSN